MSEVVSDLIPGADGEVLSTVSGSIAWAAPGSALNHVQLDNSVDADLDLTSTPTVNSVDVIDVQNSDATVWLPAASANPAGTRFLVVNSDGTCSSPANISVVANGGVGHPSPGSDTFNGAGGFVLSSAYAALDFMTDGVSAYTRIT